ARPSCENTRIRISAQFPPVPSTTNAGRKCSVETSCPQHRGINQLASRCSSSDQEAGLSPRRKYCGSTVCSQSPDTFSACVQVFWSSPCSLRNLRLIFQFETEINFPALMHKISARMRGECSRPNYVEQVFRAVGF